MNRLQKNKDLMNISIIVNYLFVYYKFVIRRYYYDFFMKTRMQLTAAVSLY